MNNKPTWPVSTVITPEQTKKQARLSELMRELVTVLEPQPKALHTVIILTPPTSKDK